MENVSTFKSGEKYSYKHMFRLTSFERRGKRKKEVIYIYISKISFPVFYDSFMIFHDLNLVFPKIYFVSLKKEIERREKIITFNDYEIKIYIDVCINLIIYIVDLFKK